MDDGQQNVISPRMLRQIHRALDTAEKERAVVMLTGREGVLSAGFDLKILKSGVRDAFTMLTGGFELAARLLAFPTPVLIACSGHAIAMGAFLVLSGDYRLGAAGSFRIVTNEVAIGLTVPFSGIELCRQRLTPAHFVRAALLAEEHTPETAAEAGFLDRVVPAEDLLRESVDVARRFTELDLDAHYKTKLRARRHTLAALKSALRRDRLDFVAKGSRRLLGSRFRK
jgi:enoyl-CoA hydratase